MPENPRIEELRRRVQADPASIAFAGLAEEFRRVGRYDEAIETCRVGLQRHPAYLSARVTLGRALIETGDFDGARQELETVLRSAPENLAAIRGLAQIHEHLGHSTEMDPHLAALAHAIPLSAPPVEPPPPEGTERAAAPNVDLDLHFNFPAPRTAAPSADSFDYDAIEPAVLDPAAPAHDSDVAASQPEVVHSTAPAPDIFDMAASGSEVFVPAGPADNTFDMAASGSAVVDPEAPARDMFDTPASEPAAAGPVAPVDDEIDMVASEPLVLDPAAPVHDAVDLPPPEPGVAETAAAPDEFDRAASEPPVDIAVPETGSRDDVAQERAPAAAAVPSTIDMPLPAAWPAEAPPGAQAADPAAPPAAQAAETAPRRSSDLDLGLTFTLAPAPAPRRDAETDVPSVDHGAGTPNAPPVESTPELLSSFEATPATEEIFHDDSPEDHPLDLGAPEPVLDPNRTATLQRLEGFLAAIQGSRADRGTLNAER